MSYQIHAATIHELEQRLAELKAVNSWKDRPELPKIKKVMSTLHNWVDPKAFVGGGCALSLKTGRPIADVDIYFTTPFNYKPGVFLERVFDGEVKSCRNEYENNLICNLVAEGTIDGIKYQFMWVDVLSGFNDEKFETLVLSSFDIYLCQIGVNMYRADPVLIETTNHKTDFGNQTLTVAPGLTPLQLKKTLETRLPKYEANFSHFKTIVSPVPIAPPMSPALKRTSFKKRVE